jgi:hypothetical protein
MRKAMKRAEEWLNRNYHFIRQVEANKRMLMILSNRLESSVSQYETDGTGTRDIEKNKQRREDLLLDYSELKGLVEKDEKKLVEEVTLTRKKIELLSKPEYISLAIDRYINRLKWEDISNLEHISKSHLYRLRLEMLEEMTVILRDII